MYAKRKCRVKGISPRAITERKIKLLSCSELLEEVKTQTISDLIIAW